MTVEEKRFNIICMRRVNGLYRIANRKEIVENNPSPKGCLRVRREEDNLPKNMFIPNENYESEFQLSPEDSTAESRGYQGDYQEESEEKINGSNKGGRNGRSNKTTLKKQRKKKETILEKIND
jgi:hypothetical protein